MQQYIPYMFVMNNETRRHIGSIQVLNELFFYNEIRRNMN